jgi:hypothetical protein
MNELSSAAKGRGSKSSAGVPKVAFGHAETVFGPNDIDSLLDGVNEAIENTKEEKAEEVRAQPKKITRGESIKRLVQPFSAWHKIRLERKVALLTCRECKSDNVWADESRGSRVCRDCGLENIPYMVDPAESNADPDILRTGSSIYDRRVHARERFKQWWGGEPRIVSSDRARLKRAYQQIGCPRSLDKKAIDFIIKTAGLPTRRLLEKWQTIAELLTGRSRIPPSSLLIDAVEADFKTVHWAWERYPEIRRGRRSIISMNFIFTQLLLRIGMYAYLRHREDFPLKGPAARGELFPIWADICSKCGWLMRVPVSVF